MDKDEFLRRERAGDQKRRKEFLNEGRKIRIPFERIKGSLSREKLAEAGEQVRGAGERVRGVVLKAATYQPSQRVQQIKGDVIDVGRTVRSEIQEAGDYYTGSRGGGRRSSRERRARYSYRETETPSVDDYYAQRSVEAYADAFSPPAFRLDSSGRPTGQRFESDVSYERASRSPEPVQDAIIFENEYTDYLQNFDPYARTKSRKRRSASDDLIGRWFY